VWTVRRPAADKLWPSRVAPATQGHTVSGLKVAPPGSPERAGHRSDGFGEQRVVEDHSASAEFTGDAGADFRPGITPEPDPAPATEPSADSLPSQPSLPTEETQPGPAAQEFPAPTGYPAQETSGHGGYPGQEALGYRPAYRAEGYRSELERAATDLPGAATPEPPAGTPYFGAAPAVADTCGTPTYRTTSTRSTSPAPSASAGRRPSRRRPRGHPSAATGITASSRHLNTAETARHPRGRRHGLRRGNWPGRRGTRVISVRTVAAVWNPGRKRPDR
jgi:hypothetical protein